MVSGGMSFARHSAASEFMFPRQIGAPDSRPPFNPQERSISHDVPNDRPTSLQNETRTKAPSITLNVPLEDSMRLDGSIQASPLEPFPMLDSTSDRPHTSSSYDSKADERQSRMKLCWESSIHKALQAQDGISLLCE